MTRACFVRQKKKLNSIVRQVFVCWPPPKLLSKRYFNKKRSSESARHLFRLALVAQHISYSCFAPPYLSHTYYTMYKPLNVVSYKKKTIEFRDSNEAKMRARPLSYFRNSVLNKAVLLGFKICFCRVV